MNPLWRQLALRSVGCALLAWLAWYLVGPVGLAVSAGAVGIALAKALLELASELFHGLRAQAYRDVEGQYYAYRGTPVRVLEDIEHVRWLRMADVRKVLGAGTSDATLATLHGAQCRRHGPRKETYLSADALLQQLARDSRAEAGRFREWVERDVAYPARQLRARVPAPEE